MRKYPLSPNGYIDFRRPKVSIPMSKIHLTPASTSKTPEPTLFCTLPDFLIDAITLYLQHGHSPE